MTPIQNSSKFLALTNSWDWECVSLMKVIVTLKQNNCLEQFFDLSKKGLYHKRYCNRSEKAVPTTSLTITTSYESFLGQNWLRMVILAQTTWGVQRLETKAPQIQDVLLSVTTIDCVLHLHGDYSEVTRVPGSIIGLSNIMELRLFHFV